MGLLKDKAVEFLDSLSNIPTRIKNGYMQFFDALKNSWQWVHRKVAEIVGGNIPRGHEVHHKNRDKLDNHPDNLQVLSKEEHRAIHRNERIQRVDRITAKLSDIKYKSGISINSSPRNFDIDRIITSERSRINALFNSFQSLGTSRGSCPRCGGTGYLPHFSHVSGGVCFLCGGNKEVGYDDFEEFNAEDIFSYEDDWDDFNLDEYDEYDLDDGHYH